MLTVTLAQARSTAPTNTQKKIRLAGNGCKQSSEIKQATKKEKKKEKKTDLRVGGLLLYILSTWKAEGGGDCHDFQACLRYSVNSLSQKQKNPNQSRWLMPVIPEHEQQRQEGHNFEVSLVYILS